MRDVIPFLCPLCRMLSRFYVHCVGYHPLIFRENPLSVLKFPFRNAIFSTILHPLFWLLRVPETARTEGVIARTDGALDAMTERGAASSLLALLPKDFTTADLIRLRARKNQSVTPTSVNSLLCRWRKLGRIDKTADAHWHRLT